MKRAVILVAGLGKRLGSLTKDIPKCLLSIDSKKTLIDFSLEALQENNIKEIVFITGFAEKRLKEHIEKKWANKLSFKFLFNKHYAEYNNIYSAYLTKDLWDDETLLLNSDIIYHPDILGSLKAKSSDMNPRSFLVIDDKKRLNSEDMKVEINAKGEIKKISKTLDIKSSFGEYIGITYLRGFERIKFLESLENNVKNNKLDLYYEDAIGYILSEISVFPFSTSGKLWTEIDTKEDYEHAKEIANQIYKVPVK